MDKKFYFLCVNGTHGGPEAIHQIVDKINCATKYKAYVVYFEKGFTPQEKFKDFRVNYIPLCDVPDSVQTVLCAPETHTHYFRKFKNATKVMVWLSLDYYLRNIKEQSCNFTEACKMTYYRSRLPKPFYPLLFVRDRLFRKKKYFVFDDDTVLHTYNCEYVASFLRKKGVKQENTAFLDGPVRKEYFENLEYNKQNIIAYNPAKGAQNYIEPIIKALQSKYSDLKLVPIQNMSVKEVKKTFLRAKAYFDFGSFPGPEKLVKESALCGCNIVTGIFGAAKNDSDILIPKNCKIDVEKESAEKIADIIADRVYNYEKHFAEYDRYRAFIKNLNDTFEQTVINFTEFCNR